MRFSSGDDLAFGSKWHTAAALGLAHETACSASAHRLPNGEGVLLYTDGLTEARGGQTRYGRDRLSAVLRERAQLARRTR